MVFLTDLVQQDLIHAKLNSPLQEDEGQMRQHGFGTHLRYVSPLLLLVLWIDFPCGRLTNQTATGCSHRAPPND